MLLQSRINYVQIFVVLIIGYSAFGCKTQEGQKRCYTESLKEIQQKPVYNTIHTSLQDTLNSWKSRKLKGVRSLYDCEWKVDDAVFFNYTYDKAILLILKRHTQALVNFGSRENPELRPPTQDNVETVFAYIENGSWQFFTYTMPTMVIIREHYGKKGPMTFEELSEIGRKEVLLSYYKKYGCQINSDCFKVKMDELKESHSKFLDNNSPIYEGVSEY